MGLRTQRLDGCYLNIELPFSTVYLSYKSMQEMVITARGNVFCSIFDISVKNMKEEF